MSRDFQRVIVTGASSGIGESLSRELARQGAHVGMIARREQHLETIAKEIREKGGTVDFVAADVGERTAVYDAIRHLRDLMGGVDLLIANAGVGKPVKLSPFNVEDMERLMRVNYLGVLYSIEAVLPEMLAQKSGHICGISSMGAFTGVPGEQAYSASKAALSNFLEGLRLQLRSEGVAVTTVHPGFVRTPMTQHFQSLPFAWSSEKAARKIVKAIRRGKKVYNFPWQLRLLMSLSRWIPDWMVARLVNRYTSTKSEE